MNNYFACFLNRCHKGVISQFLAHYCLPMYVSNPCNCSIGSEEAAVCAHFNCLSAILRVLCDGSLEQTTWVPPSRSVSLCTCSIDTIDTIPHGGGKRSDCITRNDGTALGQNPKSCVFQTFPMDGNGKLSRAHGLFATSNVPYFLWINGSGWQLDYDDDQLVVNARSTIGSNKQIALGNVLIIDDAADDVVFMFAEPRLCQINVHAIKVCEGGQ